MPEKSNLKSKRVTRREAPWPAASVADLIDSLVCECRDGVITAMNPAGRRLLGYSGQASPVGRPITDHLASKLPKPARAGVTATGKPSLVTLRTRSGGTWEGNLMATSRKAGVHLETVIVVTPHVRQEPAVPPPPAPVAPPAAMDLARPQSTTRQILRA